MKQALSALITCCIAATLFVDTPASAAEYEIDAGHSGVIFKARHKHASNVYGMIGGVEGTLAYDPDNTAKNAISVSAKSATIHTLVEGRDEHLRGPDFFNAREFPTINFKSKAWKKSDDGKYEITGDLTLLGVTKSVTAKAEHVETNEDNEGGTLIGFEATFKFDRTDFGMTYGMGGLGSVVSIIVSIEAGEED